MFSKSNLNNRLSFIKSKALTIYTKFRAILNKVVFEITDRFMATNLYAYTKRLIKAYNNLGVGIKIGAVSFVALMLLMGGVLTSDITLAYDISYKGQVIGTVGNKSLCASAVDLALNEIGQDSKDVISAPKYKLVLTLKNRLSSKQNLKDAILENTVSVAYADLLKVNGKDIVYVEDGKLQNYLNEYRDSFNLESDDSKSSFVETIEIQTGYFVIDNVLTLESAKPIINKSITVQTTATVTSEKEIAFGTTTTKSSSLLLGDSKIISAGVKGSQITTDEVVLVNGVEIERKNISTKTTRQPINQVVMVGTAKTLASASQKAQASSYGFIFPIDKSVRWSVSSYYGDGRNHKGVDICAPYKTKIYAVAAGTVTFAGYKSDYGYLVVIDHGNGLSTAYAHASVLGVSKGDKVSAGETIALVGSTGYSTGNHVHFEVRKGETRVDPSPYIGLN